MISPQLARALRVVGLQWRPASGDRFVLERAGSGGDVFAVGDTTIDVRVPGSRTTLAFTDATDNAIGSVEIDDALWLPAEHQLRALLGATFQALRRTDDAYEVEIILAGKASVFAAIDPADAYAGALLLLIGASSDEFDLSGEL